MELGAETRHEKKPGVAQNLCSIIFSLKFVLFFLPISFFLVLALDSANPTDVLG